MGAELMQGLNPTASRSANAAPPGRSTGPEDGGYLLGSGLVVLVAMIFGVLIKRATS